jgi:hypothetical protein
MFPTILSHPYPVHDFTLGPPGGEGLLAPDQLTLSSLSVPIHVATAGAVTDVDVFVALSCEDLSQLKITARSPAGTSVTLLATDILVGRSLQTVFDDESEFTFALSLGPPLDEGVQPVDRLDTFDGESAEGDWTLIFQMTGDARMAVWAAAVRVGFEPGDVTLGPSPEEVSLTNAGRVPVHDYGAVRFALFRDAAIRLALHDIAGRSVRTLQSGRRHAGEHFVTWSAAGLPPGRYSIVLDVDGAERRSLPVTVLR